MRIAIRPEIDGGEWQPLVLNLGICQQREAFSDLLDRRSVWRIRDTIVSQLEDLVRTRNPSWLRNQVDRADVQAEVDTLVGDRMLEEYGRWIYFPWSGDLVHLLPPDEFQELRLDRNRNKITLADQQELARKTIGIVGLSVGNAVATTLALEGVGGCLKLADFDRLDLSNMNRIRASVGDIGLPKTALCARQIYEMNPYAHVVLFQDGLTEQNLDAFFGGDPALDVIIDECDDIRLKVLLREKARQTGLPVLMETSDRGMLDVERFDLEPDRPLFHGLVGDLSSADVPVGMTAEEKLRFVAPIVGVETLSARSAASMLEIGETLNAWPQLGSEVLLGGASISAGLRRLILDGDLGSGRRHVDLACLLGVEPQHARPFLAKCSDTALAPDEPEPAAEHASISELMRFLVSHAIQAPSPGNSQPWRFETDNASLRVIHDRLRSQSLLDPDGRGAFVGIGAAIENVRIAAASRGYDACIDYFPEGDPCATSEDEVVATIRLAKSATAPTPDDVDLFPQIRRRLTDRKAYVRSALLPKQRDALLSLADRYPCRLTLLEQDDELAEIGSIIAEGDRLRMLCEDTHREMMAEVRWTQCEAMNTRDGLDLATLELSINEATAFRLLRRPDVASFMRRQKGGSVLTQLSVGALTQSSAVGLISVPGRHPETQVKGGQGIGALWLTATRLGLSWHPMTALIYMFNPLFSARLTSFEKSTLAKLRERYSDLLPGHRDSSQLMLFRISHGETAVRRSLRRVLDDVLFPYPPDLQISEEQS